MLELQAGVTEEREGQIRPVPHAGHAMAEGSGERREIAAVIGQFAPFHIPEQRLGGIEFGRVGRQSLRRQPATLLPEVVAHPAAPVRRQPIPQEDDTAPAEVTFELTEEVNQRGRGVGARPRLKEQATALTVPAKRQRCRHRQPLPGAKGMGQDCGFATRRPGAADDGLRREPALVFEDEPGLLAPRVFFTVGQRWRTHCRIAASSRSRARRAGRCSDQFSRRKRYQTWPG